MFHHLPLPDRLKYIFPLRPVRYKELPATLQASLSKLLQKKLLPETLVRPFHATIPMGWNWAVAIANNISSNLLRMSYTLLQAPKYATHLTSMKGQLITFSKGDSLMEAYIDDILGAFADWDPVDVSNFYNFTVSVFESHGLPRHPKKSLPLNQIETKKVTFTGWTWSLNEHRVYPEASKIAKLQQEIRDIDRSNISIRDLLSLTGKCVWFSLAQRPLLAIFDSIFNYHEEPILDKPAHPTDKDIAELNLLSNLLPLAVINLKTPWAPIIIATDASEHAGAVVYTTVSPEVAKDIYTAFLTAIPKGNMPPDPQSSAGLAYINKLKRAARNASWTTAFVHKWKRKEHISCLESSILASSLQWAASKGLSGKRTLWLTDSACSLGAFAKGRSSIRSLLARCRKAAAISIAHNLYPRFSFVPTGFNPADAPSRPHS